MGGDAASRRRYSIHAMVSRTRNVRAGADPSAKRTGSSCSAPRDRGGGDRGGRREHARGWLGTGPKVARFEEAFGRYKGADNVVAVNSCTAALHLSLLAAGIGPGDEVITSPMTFAATVNMILHAGATPVLADVDPLTMNIDPVEVAARRSRPRTRAICRSISPAALRMDALIRRSPRSTACRSSRTAPTRSRPNTRSQGRDDRRLRLLQLLRHEEPDTAKAGWSLARAATAITGSRCSPCTA